MQIRQYEKLIVWQEAHKLCIRTYTVTKSFPSEEKFGLVNQMRRSAYSIPTNLAEGNSRRSKKDKGHFVNIAVCSLEELHYQYILARDLKYLAVHVITEAMNHIQRVGYLLHKLYDSLKE